MRKEILLSTVILLSLQLMRCSSEDPGINRSDESQPVTISIQTKSASRSGLREVKVGGKISVTGEGDVELKKGVCYSKEPSPDLSDNKVVDNSSSLDFEVELINLDLNSTYYFRAYVQTDSISYFGEIDSITTGLTLDIAIDSTSTENIWVSGVLVPELADVLDAAGICWGSETLPTVKPGYSGSVYPGDFSQMIIGFVPNSNYYFRAYMILEGDTLYSAEATTATNPTLDSIDFKATSPYYTILESDILGEGNGNSEIGEMGIIYSEDANPQIENASTSDINPSELTLIRDLKNGTEYFFRTYAINAGGVTYGKVQKINTIAERRITYTMNMAENPTADQWDAYIRLTKSANEAIGYHQTYTNFARHVWINYSPGVPTADANIEGWMRFGSNRSFMNVRTVLHELSHTVGIGTSGGFYNLMSNNLWTGTNGNNALRAISGISNDVIHQSGVHMWPHGLNYDSEGTSPTDFMNHCLILEGMRIDGLF